MKNNLENKAAFVALYWGQQVRCWNNQPPDSDIHGIVGSTFITKAYLQNWHLALKSWESITDADMKDLVELYIKIHKTEHIPVNINLEDNAVKFSFYTTPTHLHSTYITLLHMPFQCYRLLISKGYYIGDGTEIEYGWVKIK